MTQASTNGFHIEYEVAGPDDGAPLLLIHGVSAQLIRWPEMFLTALADQGFRVICFDARDTGLSTRMHGMAAPDIARIHVVPPGAAHLSCPFQDDEIVEAALQQFHPHQCAIQSRNVSAGELSTACANWCDKSIPFAGRDF